MIVALKQTWKIVQYHWKTLLLFEVLYRLFGLAVIYPLINRMFSLSISVTGDAFILTRDVVDYTLRPTTIGIALLLLLVFGLYVTFEVVALAILFHQSNYEDPISIQVLLLSAGTTIWTVLKSYNLTIIMSSLTFLLLVEGLHAIGIASTIQFPTIILNELQATGWFYPIVIIAVILLLVAFFETLLFELQAIIEHKTIPDNIRASHRIMKGKRLQIISQFLVLNTILNIVLYVGYAVVIGIVGITLSLLQDSSVAYSIFLTILYSMYLIVGFIASIILIPVNYAWINTWFYRSKPTSDQEIIKTIAHMNEIKPFKRRTFERLFGMMNIVMIVIIVLVFSIGNINNASKIAFIRNPQIVSHRGGGNYAPENTLAAIEMGLVLGADAIEIDIRFSADGVPVLLHDATTGRTTNDTQNRSISSMPLEIIQTLDAGSWYDESFTGESIPTLEDALLLIDRRADIYIELKTGTIEDVETVLQLLEKTKMENHTKILSFDHAILAQFKQDNPTINTVLLVSAFTGDSNQLIDIEYVDYYGLRATLVLDNIEIIQILQQGGKGVYVWTVNDESMLDEINALGVDGIITDMPTLTRQVVYRDRTKSAYTELFERLFMQ